MGNLWTVGAPGIMPLPSGRLIRGVSLRGPDLPGPEPEFALYLLREEPEGEPVPWEYRWVDWPDFGLPADPAGAREALAAAWRRSADERVEVGCMGGKGRTGTALACIAVLDGVPPQDAVAYVRRQYDPHAVETDDQRRYVTAFT